MILRARYTEFVERRDTQPDEIDAGDISESTLPRQLFASLHDWASCHN